MILITIAHNNIVALLINEQELEHIPEPNAIVEPNDVVINSINTILENMQNFNTKRLCCVSQRAQMLLP